MKKKFLIFLFLLSLKEVSFGQHEMTLFHMNNVFQGSYVNPTLVPEHNVSIGLPGISSVYSGVYFSPFVARDIDVVQTNDTTYRINLDRAITKMSPTNNYLNTTSGIDLFSLRVKVRNLYLSLNATNVTNVRLNFPRDFFSLAWYGNAQYIGSSVNLENLGANVTQYNEYAFGLTRAKDGGKLRYGVRLKLLQGLNNVYTETSRGTISIDDDFYTHTLSAKMQSYSSSVFPYDDQNANYARSFGNFQNLGYGADLGIAYTPSRKWEITGAVNNLGAIVWTSQAKSYAIDGTYTFQGISLDSIVNNGELGLSSYLDSLKIRFHLKEEGVSKYIEISIE